MEITNEKEFILTLIKDDLMNIRLIAGLQAIGLKDASDYHLHLSQTIFTLLGYESDSVLEHKVYDEYYETSRSVLNIDIFKFPEKFDEFANDIYNKLKAEVNLEKIKKEKVNNC